jgi:DNA-binding transcriptional LysR family regulator
MTDPELRLLRYFVAVAEERHFGRAARRLHMAQPPLSQQIRKLERELGAELIDRSCRPIALTEAGRALLAEAQLCLVHAERAFAAARRVAAGQLGQVRIGAMQAAVSGVLSHVIREHRRSHPHVALEVVDLGTLEQMRQLAEHRLDVGLLRGPIDDTALAVETLLDDPLMVALADDHRLAGEARIEPASLAEQPVLLWSRAAAPTVYADVVELFRLHGIEPPVVDESPRIESILALVAAGLGVAFLPTSFLNLGRRGVRFVPLTGPVPVRPLVLAWRTDNPSANLSAFVDSTRRAVNAYRAELMGALTTVSDPFTTPAP